MAGYVRNIYGKHPTTDEPVDYVQKSVRLSLIVSTVCLFVALHFFNMHILCTVAGP